MQPMCRQIGTGGSALLPDLKNTLNFENIAAIWLTGSNEFSKTKNLRRKSLINPIVKKMMVDKFGAQQFIQRSNYEHCQPTWIGKRGCGKCTRCG